MKPGGDSLRKLKKKKINPQPEISDRKDKGPK